MALRAKIQNKYLVDLKDFKVLKKINSGSFGSVYSIEHQKTKEQYAAKVLKGGEDINSKKMINREISIMLRLRHPTIISFHGYSLTDIKGRDNVTIIMSIAKNGSLYDCLQKVQKGLANENYDNTMRQKILVGIARGMMYLHQHHVVHRDLKPGNIILDEDFNPLITDFGLSKYYEIGQSENQSQCVGTTVYMAPEVIDKNQYNAKSDVYSFGIIMYEVITDTTPYPLFQQGKMTPFQFNMKIVNEDYRPEFTVSVKESLKELIEKCWSKDPNQRPTFEQLFNKLAFNVEESIYDVLDSDDLGYYLDDVDVDELFNYVDSITENDDSNDQSDDRMQKKVDGLNKEIKSMNDSIKKLEQENQQMKSEYTVAIKKLTLENDQLKKDNEQMKKEINELKSSFLMKQPEKKIEENPGKKSKPILDSNKLVDVAYDGNPLNGFKGIFTYIGHGSAQSSLSDGLIDITASSVIGDNVIYQAKNVLNFDDDGMVFQSKNREDSWLCIDFKKYKVCISHYSIKTHKYPGDNNGRLQSWDIEGSNDLENWDQIDNRRQERSLQQPSSSSTYSIISKKNNYYRYIRIIQRGTNLNSPSYYLVISSIEFFGRLMLME